jgi:hypothetical protein
MPQPSLRTLSRAHKKIEKDSQLWVFIRPIHAPGTLSILSGLLCGDATKVQEKIIRLVNPVGSRCTVA